MNHTTSKPSARESSALKQALKHDPVTDLLRAEADRCPCEADEAFFEARDGHDTATPGSWAAEQIGKETA